MNRTLLDRLLSSTRKSPRAEWPELSSAARGHRVVVASYNIHKCVGTDGKFDPDRVAAVIAEIGADVIALQEADRRFGLRDGLLNMEALRQQTELCLAPCAIRPDSHGWHGNAILVRGSAPVDVRRLKLPYAEPRGALVAELELPQGPMRIIAAHLGLMRRYRRLQAAAILREIELGARIPTLLMGDLNEWRPNHARSVFSALEPFFGASLTHQPNSFPSRLPFLALDRILGWPDGVVETVTVHDTPLARKASDHLPIKAVIDLSAAESLAAPSSVKMHDNAAD
ncbi:endonuclease/exonuclease/phosphatase family protein [Oceanibaculum pacificum]|uniref:endonuclease/exonuclease/phosphatase family protein n=1 Tax=Oceanibaculum pacificum TaxID=580166 RepID=UPI0009FEF27F|nr:endonuclease/exonuclease/phosphatase family protein [Oceanibaculum pacificum]